jgi:hypothetical protein
MLCRSAICLLFPVAAFVLTGCGGGASTTQVSGKVTYKNASVAQGEITFHPDPANKNGVQGNAPIKDGAYDTRQGNAPSPGPVTVRIVGFDGKANPDQPAGNPIFFYEEKAELPAQTLTKDFVVPANAPKTPPEARTRPVIVP